MSLQELAKVKSHEEVKPGHFVLTLRSPRIAEKAMPGQFVHVKCSPTMDPLLRRPISLHHIDKVEGTITLLYHVLGRGTQLLSRVGVGAQVDLMGPLGQGFTIPNDPGRILVVGGGIGSAPLLPLVESLLAEGHLVTAIMGARCADYLFGTEQLSGLGAEVMVSTDDGSRGHHGLVTDLVHEVIGKKKIDFAYVCGPTPMMRATAGILNQAGIRGEVSLEERMGCGVGACLACVCKTKAATAQDAESAEDQSSSCCQKNSGNFDYQKVCVDGPVFPMGEVLWDE